MKVLTWLVSFVACIAILTGSAAAQCSRHFYNNSPVPFTFSSSGGGLCNGLVACVINPHTTSTLTYLPFPLGHMEVISRYGTHVFGLSGCYIEHSGSTHEIAVNDPADGDVTTCGRDWGCPTIRRKKHRK
jgi:hypothetical protein